MNIICFGDSLMQDKTLSSYPETGWIEVLRKRVNVPVLNFAKNGASTKSFIELGLFDNAINRVLEGDYVLVSFAHNDEVPSKVGRYTTIEEFKANLSMFVSEIRKRKAIPVFITAIYRRQFENGSLILGSHKEYSDLMKNLGKELDVYTVDMTKLSEELLLSLGDEKSKELYMNFKPGIYDNFLNGSNDNTHLRPKGAEEFTSLFIEQVVKDDFSLKKAFI